MKQLHIILNLLLEHTVLYQFLKYVPVPVELVVPQFDDHVSMRLISQFSNGISRVLQKLLKYFNGITISTWFVLHSAGVFFAIQSRFKSWLFGLHVFFVFSGGNFVYVRFFVHKFLQGLQSFHLVLKLLFGKCVTHVLGCSFIKTN